MCVLAGRSDSQIHTVVLQGNRARKGKMRAAVSASRRCLMYESIWMCDVPMIWCVICLVGSGSGRREIYICYKMTVMYPPLNRNSLYHTKKNAGAIFLSLLPPTQYALIMQLLLAYDHNDIKHPYTQVTAEAKMMWLVFFMNAYRCLVCICRCASCLHVHVPRDVVLSRQSLADDLLDCVQSIR